MLIIELKKGKDGDDFFMINKDCTIKLLRGRGSGGATIGISAPKSKYVVTRGDVLVRKYGDGYCNKKNRSNNF